MPFRSSTSVSYGIRGDQKTPTNSAGECEACIAGLKEELSKRKKKKKAPGIVYGDSQLIICQRNGKWKTKDQKRVSFDDYLENRIGEFDDSPTCQELRTNMLMLLLPLHASMINIPTGSDQWAVVVKLQARISKQILTTVIHGIPTSKDTWKAKPFRRTQLLMIVEPSEGSQHNMSSMGAFFTSALFPREYIEVLEL